MLGRLQRFVAAGLLVCAVVSLRAADTLPSQLSDAEYWKIISDFSEPDGPYPFNVVTSNEVYYQFVLPQLTQSIAPGGAYLGVGPEQNFTYIAALQPKIAFIIDIRRDMMLEHLMYKAIFELSADRADFVARLFARRRPPSLTADASVAAIFQAFAIPGDPALAESNLKEIMSHLKTTHRFPLGAEDEKRIRAIYQTFFSEGVVTFRSSIESPGYTRLMLATDASGRNWSFLASRENYDRVRTMQQKNLIVPLVGDFAGPRAVRMAGQYLREHGANVNVFYLSNVEDYLQSPQSSPLAELARAQGSWAGYVRNLASLPVDTSSTFIRLSLSTPRFEPWLVPIGDFVRANSR